MKEKREERARAGGLQRELGCGVAGPRPSLLLVMRGARGRGNKPGLRPKGHQVSLLLFVFSKSVSKWNFVCKINSNQNNQHKKIRYAPACMHKHVSNFMMNFIFNKNYLFTRLNAHQKYLNKSN